VEYEHKTVSAGKNAAGNASNLVIAVVSVPLQLLLSITFTQYVPVLLTEILFVVAPVLHKYEAMPEPAFKFFEDPIHSKESFGKLITGLLKTFLTLKVSFEIQLLTSVAITENAPAVFTIIEGDDCPVFHK
jgi:hypothetical protein